MLLASAFGLSFQEAGSAGNAGSLSPFSLTRLVPGSDHCGPMKPWAPDADWGGLGHLALESVSPDSVPDCASGHTEKQAGGPSLALHPAGNGAAALGAREAVGGDPPGRRAWHEVDSLWLHIYQDAGETQAFPGNC